VNIQERNREKKIRIRCSQLQSINNRTSFFLIIITIVIYYTVQYCSDDLVFVCGRMCVCMCIHKHKRKGKRVKKKKKRAACVHTHKHIASARGKKKKKKKIVELILRRRTPYKNSVLYVCCCE
jgi:hypothetical protein